MSFTDITCSHSGSPIYLINKVKKYSCLELCLNGTKQLVWPLCLVTAVLLELTGYWSVHAALLVLPSSRHPNTLGAPALSVFAGQREEGEEAVQAEAGGLDECLLTDPALVLPPAGPAVEVTLPALEAGALHHLPAVRAGDLLHQLLQQHQASAGDLLAWQQH